jgi:hypothetical protein
VVYAAEEFSPLGPAPLPVSPDWSPAGVYGVYQSTAADTVQQRQRVHRCNHSSTSHPFGFGLGFACDCFAF